MVNLRMRRRAALLIAAVVAIVVGGLAGGAGTSQAATLFQVDLTPLIGSADNTISQVSYGGKIGYHLFVQNQGDSTTTQASVVVTSDLATYFDSSATFDSSPTTCAANPDDAHQMICTIPGGTMRPGDSLDVSFRFTAPTTGTQVSTQAAITVAARTVGGSKNQGTVLQYSQEVLTALVAADTNADTFLRKTETAETGGLSSSHPQNFGVQLPGTLIGDPFGLDVSIHDRVGTPICDTCLTSFTALTIPAASLVTALGNPFFDGINAYPHLWTMDARYPPGFKLTKVVHVDDNASVHTVPSCADTTVYPAGAPTAAEPICWDTLDQNTKTKTVSATGRGLENGLFGLG